MSNSNAPDAPRRLTQSRVAAAMEDPTSVFAAPEEVRDHPELTRDEKIEILRRWQYDAVELGVAVEEGMPGEDDGMLRRIMLALGALAGPIDVEHLSPTKQHGLPRSAVAHKGDKRS